MSAERTTDSVLSSLADAAVTETDADGILASGTSFWTSWMPSEPAESSPDEFVAPDRPNS